ncbi:hypothetical protein GCK72_004975 [Caenorhabditis remanei]|uniref:Uncharacterized protein n=1 Tax=Caenorhabditis remanei TaxID=31234 RepID=A0A6A5HDV2_CAERE|nr:hypothetical protein GCK72_004975 [Caenorhabditis remanei]KAF1765024.1 hypothetical protein GCK72_004975 [Caenorhabditis remanei]
MLLLPILVHSALDPNFQEEQFLKDPQQFEQVEEGSGENTEDVLVSENSTTTSSSRSSSTSTSSTSTPSILTSSTSTHSLTTPAKPINCYDISKRCSKLVPLCTREEYKTVRF